MTPELRFAHWLRGYLEARRIGQTAIEGLTGQDVLRIGQELQFATGDMVQLGRGLSPNEQIGPTVYRAQEQYDKAQADANRLANVFACQGQTIPTMQEQMQKNEIRPKHQDGVAYLGGGYGVPRGVR